MPNPSNPRPARRTLLAMAALGAAFWLAGCASLKPETAEDVVRQRAEARWHALIDGNFEKAWDYTQPGFRAVVPRDRYFRRFGAGARWTGVQVHEINCAAERCTVRVRVSAKVQTPPFNNQEIATMMDEIWLREDGQWWYYQAF